MVDSMCVLSCLSMGTRAGVITRSRSVTLQFLMFPSPVVLNCNDGRSLKIVSLCVIEVMQA